MVTSEPFEGLFHTRKSPADQLVQIALCFASHCGSNADHEYAPGDSGLCCQNGMRSITALSNAFSDLAVYAYKVQLSNPKYKYKIILY